MSRSTAEPATRVRIRMAGVVAVVAIVATCISDYFTPFWTDHPMLAAYVSGLLLVVLGGAVINEFLAVRARRRWQTVAALAVTQMRDTMRGFVVMFGQYLGVEDSESSHPLGVRRLLEGGDDEGSADLIRRGTALLADPERRRTLARSIDERLRDGQQVAVMWSPVMVGQEAYVELLEEYVALLNRSWQVLWALSEDEARLGQQAPPDPAIAEVMTGLIQDMLAFQRELTGLIRSLLPWPAAFGPAPEWVTRDDSPDLGGPSSDAQIG